MERSFAEWFADTCLYDTLTYPESFLAFHVLFFTLEVSERIVILMLNAGSFTGDYTACLPALVEYR